MNAADIPSTKRDMRINMALLFSGMNDRVSAGRCETGRNMNMRYKEKDCDANVATGAAGGDPWT